MKLKVFTVYDAKAEIHLNPFFLKTAGEATRGFEQTVNDPSSNSQLSKTPEDFTLFEVGVWDDENAIFQQHEAKIPLGNGLEYKKQ